MPKLRDNKGLLRKPKMPLGWVRRMIEQTHTQEEWIEMIRGLPDHVQVQFLVATQPKEVKVDGETKIELIINGIRQIKSIDNHAVASLDEHDPAVDNSDD